MAVIGIDVGFSDVKESCSYCVVDINSVDNSIVLLSAPRLFNYKNINSEIDHLMNSSKILEPQLIAIDAPLTMKRLVKKPDRGRKIDRLFSQGLFSNSKRGPQPGSISTPIQGWQLYEAGFSLLESFRSGNCNIPYLSINDLRRSRSTGIVEVIPKLAQSLLVSRECVISRNLKIDDYIFPRLYAHDGCERNKLDSAFSGYSFDSALENELDRIAANPRRYHEELASIVAALQGVLFLLGRSSVIGFSGEYEGYYVLPAIDRWNPLWKNEFAKACRVFTDIMIL